MERLLSMDTVQLMGCLILLVGLIEAKLPDSSSIKPKIKFLLFILAISYTITGLMN